MGKYWRQIDASGTTNVEKTVDSRQTLRFLQRAICSTREKNQRHSGRSVNLSGRNLETHRKTSVHQRFRLSHIWLIQLSFYRMISWRLNETLSLVAHLFLFASILFARFSLLPFFFFLLIDSRFRSDKECLYQEDEDKIGLFESS